MITARFCSVGFSGPEHGHLQYPIEGKSMRALIRRAHRLARAWERNGYALRMADGSIITRSVPPIRA